MNSKTDGLGRREDLTFDAGVRVTGEKWYDASSALVNTKTFTYDAVGNQLGAECGVL